MSKKCQEACVPSAEAKTKAIIDLSHIHILK